MVFRRNALQGWLGALGLAALLLIPAGCDNSDSSGNVTGPMANLVVIFSPNPVMHSGYGEWHYEVAVRETSGVGVHIYGFIRKSHSAAGESYSNDVNEELAFIDDFDGCGGEGNYIPGGGIRCGFHRISDGRNSGFEVWTFYGVDDFGNEVTGEGRVDLL